MLAEQDPLTGLYNRRYVDAQLSLALMRLRDGGPELAIAMIDLDHFKRVNDRFSHEVGDDVLRELGELLSRCADAVRGGVAARIGGEEFLVILPGTDRAAARTCFEAPRREIADRDWAPIAAGLAVTASIGVVSAPGDGQRSSALLRLADERLYAAKAAGRNIVIADGADETSR
ncbi:GGDEF domain-containing protein [Pengzhenrongella sicca]|uniref:GGDEF domain-containing protein n=1 Tax=Pengzhenrongella sicca TaxID=2819238 RepID=A0A8A4ZFD0_9MICO|nr:GGDEF domain-containing protein [Pengzhenrongella sicca]QTE30005.1 GGDEF domain-containing protein [Pengzhenrongella sicca]